jgi:tetratricopeptide (TPR) repeat protein
VSGVQINRIRIPMRTDHFANVAVDELLKQAIAFHQAGQLQEAQAQYAAILQSVPNHPVANHNMGFLLVQQKQAASSLPYFVTALNADPAQGQYWLSYIDALIQAGQLDEARQVLTLARQHGLQGDKVEELAVRLNGEAQATAQANAEDHRVFEKSSLISTPAAQNSKRNSSQQRVTQCSKKAAQIGSPRGEYAKREGIHCMKICWIGWAGPEMDEMASGILALDPEAQFLRIGTCWGDHDESPVHFPKGRKLIDLRGTQERSWDIDQLNEYDVVVFNCYEFSAGHRADIKGWGPRLSDFPLNRKYKLVLHDGESFSQLAWYTEALARVDALITFNPALARIAKQRGMPVSFQSMPPISPAFQRLNLQRDIPVLFTGSCLDKGYRAELASVVRSVPGAVVTYGLPTTEYIQLLNRALVVVGTKSCASGHRDPMHVKDRAGKALACGALPMGERFIGDPLEDWQVPFSDQYDLAAKLSDAIRGRSSRLVMRNIIKGAAEVDRKWRPDVLYRRAFAELGLTQ